MIPVDLKNIEDLIEPAVSSLNCELVACEWGNDAGQRVLRVLIDKPGGVLLSDCEELSRLIDPLLEVEGIISERYNLEVSSPGLNRPLRKIQDFERFLGELVFIKIRNKQGERGNYKGRLKEVKDGIVKVEVDRSLHEIPFENIIKANLEIDLSKILKSNKK